MTTTHTFLLCFLLLLVLTGCSTTSTGRLKPFVTDGCSCFPDGTLAEPMLWRRHCEAHDLAYWMGGTWEQRREADRELRDKIAAEGVPLVAGVVYLGVRIGGVPWLPTPWRWGFGWPYPRGYGALTRAQREQILELGSANASVAQEAATGSRATARPRH